MTDYDNEEEKTVQTKVNNLVQELSAIAGEKKDVRDYEGKIDKWNRYYSKLRQIRGLLPDNAKLRMNVHHNLPGLTNMRLAGLVGSALFAIGCGVWMLFVGRMGVPADAGFVTGQILALLALGNFGRLVLYTQGIIKPYYVTVSAHPKIHIDEARYTRQVINGIPDDVKLDPVVRLPAMTLRIPRSEMSTKALLDVMNRVGNVSL